MKSPLLKVIDFDSVVKNTKVAKSIILIRSFSNLKLLSRSSEVTNRVYLSFCGLSLAGGGLTFCGNACGHVGGENLRIAIDRVPEPYTM